MYIKPSDVPQGRVDRVVYADKLTKPTSNIAGIPTTEEEYKLLAAQNNLPTISPKLLELGYRMVRAAALYDGVGIAANQIGIPLRMFTIKHPASGFLVYLHPTYTVVGVEKQTQAEGCLSVPNTTVCVSRPETIAAKWFEFDESGVLSYREETLSGMNARVFLHEHDHLCGKSLLDYMPRDRRRAAMKMLARLK